MNSEDKEKQIEQKNVTLIIRNKYEEMRLNDATLSLRSFARKLNVSPATISEILKGKRRISLPMAKKLAQKLALSPRERSLFFEDVGKKLKRNKKDANDLKYEFHQLEQAQFKLISSWVHFAILSLIKTIDFQTDTKWIGERLGQEEKTIKSALKDLFDLALIDLDQKGNIFRTTKSLTTSKDIVDVSIQKSHLNDLDNIRKYIDVDVQLRDYCSYTLPVNPSLMPEAKRIIRQAQDQIYDLMASSTPTEVYRMNSYFYPLSLVRN